MLNPVMNHTKWEELRLAMYSLDPAPRWSTLSNNGYQSQPDREWFYHFRTGGYEDILQVDIFADSPEHRRAIYAELKKIHVPGVETADGFRVFGYVSGGEAVEFL